MAIRFDGPGGLTGTYQPIQTSLFVPSTHFFATSGSPALGLRQRWPVLLFDASATEIAAVPVMVPVGWATLTVKLMWTNPGAGSGDVRWLVGAGTRRGDGDTLVTETTPAATLTAPAQDVVQLSASFGATTVEGGKANLVAVRREGGDAADTLANDAAVIGVLLEKAS